MNKGVIFFIVIVLAVLAIVFIPKNKDNTAPVMDETMMTEEMSQDMQGAAVEALDASADAMVETPMTDAAAEGVVEVPATETTPTVTE